MKWKITIRNIKFEMEYFVRSEIARLVLGYLKEEGCDKAYKTFLSESPHLREYASLLKRGRQYPTSINGKSLQDMVHMYGYLYSKDLIDRFKYDISGSKDNGSGGSKLEACDDASDAASSSVGGSKFNFSSDSDDNPSTPTDTEDSGVASTTHSTVPRTSPNDWKINSSLGFKGSRIPRPKSKGKLVKRCGKLSHQRSPKRPLGCSISPVNSYSPLKASTSNSVTPFNTHRKQPNRTKVSNDSSSQQHKSIFPQEISSILPCNDESVDMVHMSPMLSSTRQSFLQSSRSVRERVDEKKAKVQSSQAPNQLRALLSRPPTYSVTSTPRVSCSTAKKDTYKITIASPSRSASSTSVGTPVREQGPTTTVTTQCFDPTGNAAAVVAKTEESVDLSSQISDIDCAEMRSFGFKTPLKRDMESPASSIGIGKSPRRKCSAPRRRSQGTDVVLVPPATAKPTTTCTTTVASTSVVTSSSGITSATSTTKDPNSENLPANPIVEELASNRNLVEKLAETINKHVRFDLGRSSPTEEPKENSPESKPDLTDGATQHLTNSDSLDVILDLGTNIDEALQEIVDHTKNEPAFDSLFKMFNIDKYKFIEEEYGVEPVPASSSGLVTPPCPVVTDVSSSTSTTCSSHLCNFGSTPPVNSSLHQPVATYSSSSITSANCAQAGEPIQSIVQQAHPSVQSSLEKSLPTVHLSAPVQLPSSTTQTTNAVFPQFKPAEPIAFIPVMELKPGKKTNDPSKIKSSVHSASDQTQPLGSLTLLSDLPMANDLPGLESMPVLHIDDCDPNSEDVLMGRVHTASIIHPSKSGSSPEKVETVRIVGYELPQGCQQLINTSADKKNTKPGEAEETVEDPIYEQLEKARKPSTEQTSPRKPKRLRSYSSSTPTEKLKKEDETLHIGNSETHLSQGPSLEKADGESTDIQEPVPFSSIVSNSEEVVKEKEANYTSDGCDAMSVSSTDRTTRRTRPTVGQKPAVENDTQESSPKTRRLRTRSSARLKFASRSVSVESTTSSKERKNGLREKVSLKKQPEDTENGIQTTEEVSTMEQLENQLTVKDGELNNGQEKATSVETSDQKSKSSKSSKTSNKKKTKKDKGENNSEKKQETSLKSRKRSSKTKRKSESTNVSRELDPSTPVKSSQKSDAVEMCSGLSEVSANNLENGKPCNVDVLQDSDTDTSAMSHNHETKATTGQKTPVHSGSGLDECVSDKQAPVGDIFQTPNEYNRSIGFNVSDPDHKQSVVDEESKQSEIIVNCQNGSQNEGVDGDHIPTKKKITRKKIKRKTGPLTIAAKKLDCGKSNGSTLSDCSDLLQDSETTTPAYDLRKVPTYIAPTPSPASSFSSAGMTPKHVRMLDFGVVHTPPGLPGQSPPISSIGAQVTLGFRSPLYGQLGTPGSVRSQGGGSTPTGSEYGFSSPAYQPSPGSCGPQTPTASTINTQQEPPPPFLSDHAFGNFNVTHNAHKAMRQVDTQSSCETPLKTSAVPEDASEESRFAASLSKVESPNIIRALANTIGIPTEDGDNNTGSESMTNATVFQSPPELPNFGRNQTLHGHDEDVAIGGSLPVAEAGGDKEAAETLLAMARTPVSEQPDHAGTPANESLLEHNNPHIPEQQPVSDGAHNEDRSSSSVASSVLMPPPTMTPKRSMYKTPRKQMIHTPYSVSPAKSPGLKSLIEASFISELSQSPRTSQKNLEMMDQFLDETIRESPASKQNTPVKIGSEFGAPLTESPLKSLLDTPNKSMDAFVSQFMTPQSDTDITTNEEINTNETDPKGKDNSTVTSTTPKKKKKKSKDKSKEKGKEKEKKEKRRSKSKSKKKDKYQEASDSPEKKRKKAKHKRSKSKKEEITDASKAWAQGLLTQTPLGSRSPLVCGMSPSRFDGNSNSPHKAFGDIALLMAQVGSPSKSDQFVCPDGSVKGALSKMTSNGSQMPVSNLSSVTLPANSSVESVTVERRPLAEKSTAGGTGEAKRGKKRHRHKEDKEDTTPEKKKQKREVDSTAQITELKMSKIESFLDDTHSAQSTFNATGQNT